MVGQSFDVVLANPPHVPASSDRLPRHGRGRSWDGGRDRCAVIDRICDEVSTVLCPGGRLLMVESALAGEAQTVSRLRARGFDVEVVARADEPFGPVMRSRASMLRARGLLSPDQVHEELLVVQAVARTGSSALSGPALDSAA